MASTTPLLRGFTGDATVTWCDGRELSARAFCATAIALSARLPASKHVVNLCETGPFFLLASAAAWCNAQTVVLPPDRLARTLERIGAQYGDVQCLCDSAEVARFAQQQGLRAHEIRDLAETSGDVWPPPPIPSTLVAAILFTSGSTGAPRPHAKTWGALVDGVATFVQAFGQPAPQGALLGTVAPQHMFGFETTVMLSLQAGVPLLPQRPALPADLREALEESRTLGRNSVWLLTTPLQLQAFHTAGTAVGLARVIASTMPLDAGLARAVEQDWNVRVDEIYGCTEGGMLAHRRGSATEFFTAGAGIRFMSDAEGCWTADGGHLPAAIPLADRLDTTSDESETGAQRFRVLGRDDDVVKIAGKRASLAGLTAKLLAIPGVREGMVFLPALGARRLNAAVVAPGLTEADLKVLLAAEIDPAFLPRRWWLLDQMPRGMAGKISIAALRDLASGPDASRPAAAAPRIPGVLTAAMTMPADHPALEGHFPGHPIVPGVILIEWVEGLLARNFLTLRECSSIKFHTPLSPAEPAAIRVEVAADLTARFAITRGATLIAAGACRCTASASAR